MLEQASAAPQSLAAAQWCPLRSLAGPLYTHPPIDRKKRVPPPGPVFAPVVVYSGRVELVRAARGFCVSIREMNDALLWLTIEGAPSEIEAQLWLSTFGLELAEVDAFEKKWQRQLQNIFA